MTDPFASGLPSLLAERLVLRHPREADVPAFLRVFGNAEDLKYWSHGPLVDEAAARAYLADIERFWRDREMYQWAIADRETDELIGFATLNRWDQSNRRADVGFILARSHWGRGLAQEAVRRVLTFGFEVMNLHRVEADVDPENEGSLTLLVKLGFQREGHFRERWYTFGSWKHSVMLGLLKGEMTEPRAR